jgi:Zincin-like metallopeptidase
MIEVEPGRFEEMVITALDGLPEDLGQLMRNVAVTVEHGPGPPGLLGLYQGIPLTSRTSDYAGVLPDRITIYRQEICAIAAPGRRSPTRSAERSSTRSPTISALMTTGSANSAGKTPPAPEMSSPAPQGLTYRLASGAPGNVRPVAYTRSVTSQGGP